MPVLASPRHEAFAHALARGSTASAAYIEAGYKQNRHNAGIESLIAEAEAARAKAMEEKGGAAAAVSALIAKAKLAGMWREKVDQHNTGPGSVSTVWNVSWEDENDGRPEAHQD